MFILFIKGVVGVASNKEVSNFYVDSRKHTHSFDF